MSRDDGKLLATAMGAATAGAALAVMAMKMIDGSKDQSGKGGGESAYNNSGGSVLAYHQGDKRPVRTSVIMNDPSDLHESISHGSMNMKREASDAMLFPHNHEEKMRRRIATRYTIEEENNLGRDSVTSQTKHVLSNIRNQQNNPSSAISH